MPETAQERIARMKMYHVEKFWPTHCPKCERPFLREPDDWSRFLGDIVNGEKRVRETTGYSIAVCNHCHNMTAWFQLESYQLKDRKAAEALIEQGFVNLLEVEASGNHCRDMHTKVELQPSARLPEECPNCRLSLVGVQAGPTGLHLGEMGVWVGGLPYQILECPKCHNRTAAGEFSTGVQVKGLRCD